MPPDPVDLSLNEVEVLAQKAARGGGHAWGIADDAGRSARWLAVHGCDWADGLLSLLDAPPPPECCPLRLGGFLADSSGAEGAFAFASIARPLWLLPPLLQAAAMHRMTVAIALDGISAAAAPGAPPGASVSWAEIVALEAAEAVIRITRAAGTPLPYALLPARSRCRLPEAMLARLAAYAARTSVPASDHSRSRGAGSLSRDDE